MNTTKEEYGNPTEFPHGLALEILDGQINEEREEDTSPEEKFKRLIFSKIEDGEEAEDLIRFSLDKTPFISSRFIEFLKKIFDDLLELYPPTIRRRINGHYYLRHILKTALIADFYFESFVEAGVVGKEEYSSFLLVVFLHDVIEENPEFDEARLKKFIIERFSESFSFLADSSCAKKIVEKVVSLTPKKKKQDSFPSLAGEPTDGLAGKIEEKVNEWEEFIFPDRFLTAVKICDYFAVLREVREEVDAGIIIPPDKFEFIYFLFGEFVNIILETYPYQNPFDEILGDFFREYLTLYEIAKKRKLL